MNQVILTMQGICKTFSGVTALSNASFELCAGEVHALMGENGAGKSTLMKILTGIYSRDAGTVIYEGREVEYKNPKEARDDCIVIVHQELQMMNHLTVAQNIFIGREPMKFGLFIDEEEMNKQARSLFELLNINIDPKSKLGDLTIGHQQMVEIAKAISTNAKVMVFDEPTAALTESEISELFKIIRNLQSKGIGIIYISHRMDEIAVITDRVSIMRDGEYVGTLITKNTNKDEIIDMMVGRTIYETPKSASNVSPEAPVVLKVEHLNVGKRVIDVSFELRRGEILGFAGLMGAGRTEVGRAIFGADIIDSGHIYVHGKKVEIHNPQDATAHGICYLSEDRKRYGVLVDMSVADNIVLSNLDIYERWGLIDESRVHEDSKTYIDKLKIKTPGTRQLVVNLSGGNQQKVIISKWLNRDSDILIFDEPTRGIDVGAKSEIYRLMSDLVAEGKSIIMISSELTEILRMSDRIVVMCEGRKSKELDISEATQENIIKYATRE